MKRLFIFLLAISLCLSISVFSASSYKLSTVKYVPGEILVKYKPGTELSRKAALNAAIGARTIKQVSDLRIHRTRFPENISVGQALSHYRSDPSVEYAEPNYIYKFARTPNDTWYTSLWSLNNTGQRVNGTAGAAGSDMSAETAWDTQTAGNAFIVAVIDSGVDYGHEDIAGNMIGGWDFLAGTAAPMDSMGHGTHVAGIIGAVGNNGLGTTGVSWTARIMPLRVGDSEGLAASDIVESIDYARTHGAKIINASFGGYDESSAIRDAISAANTAGVLFIASAGNESNDNDIYPVYPASYGLPNIISVGATNQNDTLCPFSNYGRTSVHVASPGSNIYSLAPSRADHWLDDFSANHGWTFGGSGTPWRISGGVLTNVPYANDTNSWAKSPVLNLSGFLACRLVFQIRGGCEYPNDVIYIEFSGDGENWDTQPLISYSGTSSAWYEASLDIRAYDNNPNVRMRFRFVSDSSDVTGGGWEIDNFKITSSFTDHGTAYEYMAGTSMAAPHVTGMAALIWSRYPAYTAEQIRYIILNSTEPLAGLSGTVSTGGRVNLFNALNLPASPTGLTATAVSAGRVDLRWTGIPPGASGYRIESKTGVSGIYSQIGMASINSTSFTHNGAPPSSAVYYRVRSYNNSGNSFYSDEVSVTTPAGSPGADGGGGGCFIATAAYGSPLERSVKVLRAFRDRYLLSCGPGRKLVQSYYGWSPPVADFISTHETAKTAVRALLAPSVAVAWLSVELGAGTTAIVFMLIVVVIAFFFRLRKIMVTSP